MGPLSKRMYNNSADVDAVKSLIGELESLDLKTVEDSFVQEKILKLLGSYGTSQLGVDPSRRLYRVRKNLSERLHSSSGLEWHPPLFSELKQLWYPLPEHIRVRGRVNGAGQSVFYCANSIDTAVLEMRPKDGEYLTILESGFIDQSVELNVFETGIHEGPGHANPRYGGTPPDQDHDLQRFVNLQGWTETTPLIRKFLVKQFMRIVESGNEHEYKITNAIATVLLTEFDFVRRDDLQRAETVADGLAYASIASQAKGANIAFTCEAADRLLRPLACCVFRVEQRPQRRWPRILRTHRAKEFTPDGQIIW